MSFVEYPKAMYPGGDAAGVMSIANDPAQEAALREQGLRMIGDAAPEPEQTPEQVQTVESVRVQLDAAGIDYDKRLGLDKLQALLPA